MNKLLKPSLVFGLLAAIFLSACQNHTQKLSEKRDINFNYGWKFLNDDPEKGELVSLDDSKWRNIDLPHDISIEDLPVQDSVHIGPFFKGIEKGVDVGYLSGGIAWYRKHFTLDPSDKGKQVVLNFDGVQTEASVFVNGMLVKEHKYGYSPFNVNISPFLNDAGKENVLAVKVINRNQCSRWYTGFGIYRGITMSVLNPLHIADWGVFVSAPQISDKEAMVKLEVHVANAGQKDATIKLSTEIINPDKTVVNSEEQELSITAGGNAQAGFEIPVSSPVLWDLASPKMYTARIRVLHDGHQTDEYLVDFGIRSIDFSAEKGFLLNGKTVLLKGACVHHDNGILGAAAFKDAEYRRVATLKKNGFNAIRTSHNPPSAYFLDACDQLGMLVIDEAFDMWEKEKRKNDYHLYFNETWESDLEAMVLRDRNHPAIIMWSYGNEIQERASERGIELGKMLVAKIKSLDTGRPTTQSICDFWDNPGMTWEKNTPAAFDVMDIAGYNYKWNKYLSDHELYPHRIMYASESLPKEAFENWDLVEKYPYIIGDFVWTGMDYLGESGIGRSEYRNDQKDEWMGLPEWPWFISWCGDIDILGNKKPQSYYRDVLWGNSNLEILVHEAVPDGMFEHVSAWGWPLEEPHWNREGDEGKSLQVRVFSSCEQVRLELNGQIIGSKAVSDETKRTAVFRLPYHAGELTAIGLNDGKEVCRKTLKTTGKSYQLKIIPEKNILTDNSGELAYFNIEVQDENGLLVPTAVVPVVFEVEGDCKIQAVGNACPTEMKSFQQNHVNSFRGQCQLILRLKNSAGTIRVRASSEGLVSGESMLKL